MSPNMLFSSIDNAILFDMLSEIKRFNKNGVLEDGLTRVYIQKFKDMTDSCYPDSLMICVQMINQEAASRWYNDMISKAFNDK